MNLLKPLLAATAVSMLAACSFSFPGSDAPSPALAPPAQSTAPATTSFGANTGGTYPYGTASSAPLDTAAGAEQEGIVVMDPEGNVWVRPDSTDARYREDVESCYSYAQARVDHDVRIENDVNAAFQSSARGFGLSELRGRMSNFERTQSRPILFTNCMVAKGYAHQ